MSGAIGSFTMRAALGSVPWVVTQMQQRIERRVCQQDYVATASTIAAGWTTTRHKLLTPESRYAVTSVTPLHVNLGAINKHPKLKATPGAQSLLLGRRELARTLF